MIKKIELFKQSLHSNDHMVIATPIGYNPKKQRVLISVNNKVAEAIYNPETKNVTALLDAPPANANHPLASQLPQNAAMRVKVFMYDFIEDKILGAKLQDFEYNTPTLSYKVSDELLSTSPVIIGDWDKKGLVDRAMKEEKLTEIKIVELNTELENGSANDNSGKNLQFGMIYGKNYSFKVTEYTQEKPKDLKKISWYIKYYNLTLNKWEEVTLKNKGTEITIHMNNLEMCGRYIYVRAYLNDKKVFGEAKVWMHNRFKWIDRLIVEKEIEDRLKNPWKIRQSGTSLCGMACIFYLFAKEQPTEYKKFAKELFRKGIATFNKYTIKPTLEILDRKPNKDGINIGAGNMPLVDYITLAGGRNTDNPKYKGGDEMFEAVNWPILITDLLNNLLDYKKIIPIYFPVKPLVSPPISEINLTINTINIAYKNGYKLLLMIDSDLIEDISETDSLDYHWVVLESPINLVPYLKSNGDTVYLVDFNVYTWGTNPNGKHKYLKEPISMEHFISNYYGFIKVK